MASPIELLVTLGIDDTKARADVKSAIDRIQKNLNLNIDNKDIFKGLSQAFENEITNIRRTSSNLDDYLKREFGDYKLNFVIDENGIRRLRSITANVRDDLGNINRIQLKPRFDGQGVFQGLRAVSQQINDISTKGLDVNVNRAINEITRLRDQGKITSDQFDRYSQEISNSLNNLSLDNSLNQIRQQTARINADFNLDDGVRRFNNQLEALRANLQRTGQTYKNSLDPNVLRQLEIQIQSLSSRRIIDSNQLRNARSELDQIRSNFSLVSQEARQASSQANSFSSQLSNIAQRVGVFSLVYQSINVLSRGIRDITEQVISLDTQLVSLRRVLDLPDYEFNNLLERTIENVDRLSGNVSDYLELVGEFGRSGLNGDQAIELANTATLLQNISDLDASGSFDALTAAMINFNIAAEDSIVIADALNEVNIISLLS